MDLDHPLAHETLWTVIVQSHDKYPSIWVESRWKDPVDAQRAAERLRIQPEIDGSVVLPPRKP